MKRRNTLHRGLQKIFRVIPKRELLFLIAGACLLTTGFIIIWASSLQIPDLNQFVDRRIAQSTKIYDRTGTVVLHNLQENTRRTVVPFDSISRNIKNATIAIEDAEFYEHSGIKPTAILRAIISNVLIKLHLNDGYTQGGSTITQQVVKNSLLTTEKSLVRKIKEWILAVKLERVMPKDEILNVYLNENPYGGNIYGVEEASEAFFGKHASELTLAEAAYLAAIPQAPTYYSPYGRHTDALESRKNTVLARMLENKFITKDEYTKAKVEKITFRPQEERGIKAPHFIFYVRDYLARKYGEDALQERGLKVTTTLDWELEQKGEDIVKRYALQNKKNFNAENASLVAIDPKTGQILTMVGSRDYFDTDIDGAFNIALAHRQPGSSFKPFVYATAFMKGYTPDTVVFDLKTQFSTNCEANNFSKESPCFSPDNYDNVFRGPVTLRNALAQSLNIPAVKVLYLAGIHDSLATAASMGITSLTTPDRYGLTLVLGGGEVSLLDMTSAYGVFANDGVRNEPIAVLKVEDNQGNVLEEYTPNPKPVIDPMIAHTVSDVLSDNAARTPAFGATSALFFPGHQIAVKTGTTNDYRDAWILGYSPSIAVGAWAGNNDNSPMEKKVAGFIVAPLWHEFMQTALESLPTEIFPPAPSIDPTLKPAIRGVWQGGQTYIVDRFSGALATENTPIDAREERVVQNVHSILYWVDKDNPLGPTPKNPNDDPQFIRWETPVRAWAQEHGYGDQSSAIIPVSNDTIHTQTNFHLNTTLPNGTIDRKTKVTFTVTSTGAALRRVDIYINEVFIGSATQSPFQFSFMPNDIEGIKTVNTLTIVGYDNVLNQTKLSIPLNLKN